MDVVTKRALITGITGQDGSYLAEFLIEKGYEVHGMVRRSSLFNRGRIDHLFYGSESSGETTGAHYLHYGDLTDASSVNRLLREIRPDEIYNLGAQSHVKVSFEIPEYTGETVGLGTLRLLEGIRESGLSPRFYQAGSSEMFGLVREIPQKETTPFYPRSPYGAAKVYAHWIAVNYREAYDMHVCNGILFNHESPRRGESFVTRKITLGAAAIKLGLKRRLALGNLEAKRDWGYARDYVEAMWLMLQQPKPDDYVVATGETHSVREFCELAFGHLGLDYRDFVVVDPLYFRPTEVDVLIGDATKAREKLGWTARTNFQDLVRLMMDSDLELLKANRQSRTTISGGAPAAVTARKKTYSEIDACRICGNAHLESILDLGTMALSGVFPRNPESTVTSGPLELVKCATQGRPEACGLVQLRQTYDLDELYGENYGYRSSLNRSMIDHLSQKARSLSQLAALRTGDTVVDIGSNDGTLLAQYGAEGLTLVGIDPTAAKFRQYYRPDVHVIADFFSAERFRSRFGDAKAKLVTSISMFYDLERPMAFMEQVRDILDDEGIWHFEQSYLPLMLRRNSYDTVCHEHLEYYALRQILWMAERVGLRLIDASLNEINGGSIAITAVKAGSSRQGVSPQLATLLAEEDALRLDAAGIYDEFRKRIEAHRAGLLELLDSLERDGRTVLGYGASTKGNTILQYCGIGPERLPAVAEVNTDKFGCFTPGTGIPIISESRARGLKPNYYLVLPWHFREHIVRREAAFLKAGGKIIFPLPKLEIVSG
jgi:GDPmannose 4,6-dehydratase